MKIFGLDWRGIILIGIGVVSLILTLFDAMSDTVMILWFMVILGITIYHKDCEMEERIKKLEEKNV